MIEEIQKELEDWAMEPIHRFKHRPVFCTNTNSRREGILNTFNYAFINPYTKKPPQEAAKLFLAICQDAPESIKNKILLLSL